MSKNKIKNKNRKKQGDCEGFTPSIGGFQPAQRCVLKNSSRSQRTYASELSIPSGIIGDRQLSQGNFDPPGLTWYLTPHGYGETSLFFQ